MRAVKLPAQVNVDHTLHLVLPDDIDAGPAEVIVLVPDAEDDEVADAKAGSLAEFLAGPQIDRRHLRSKEEIDDYLRAERESWE